VTTTGAAKAHAGVLALGSWDGVLANNAASVTTTIRRS
jgi:hypothetical protein